MPEQDSWMRKVRRALAALCLFLAVVVAGCAGGELEADKHAHGHDEGQGTLPFTGAEEQIIEVSAGSPDEFRFSPAVLTARAGSSVGVIYTNGGGLEHDISIPAIGFHLLAGQNETVRGAFITPKEDVEILCTIPGHAEAGMKGILDIAP